MTETFSLADVWRRELREAAVLLTQVAPGSWYSCSDGCELRSCDYQSSLELSITPTGVLLSATFAKQDRLQDMSDFSRARIKSVLADNGWSCIFLTPNPIGIVRYEIRKK